MKVEPLVGSGDGPPMRAQPMHATFDLRARKGACMHARRLRTHSAVQAPPMQQGSLHNMHRAVCCQSPTCAQRPPARKLWTAGATAAGKTLQRGSLVFMSDAPAPPGCCRARESSPTLTHLPHKNTTSCPPTHNQSGSPQCSTSPSPSACRRCVVVHRAPTCAPRSWRDSDHLPAAGCCACVYHGWESGPQPATLPLTGRMPKSKAQAR